MAATQAPPARPQAPPRAAAAVRTMSRSCGAGCSEARRPIVLAGSSLQRHADALQQFAEDWAAARPGLVPAAGSVRQLASELRRRDGAGEPARADGAVPRGGPRAWHSGARLSDITTQGYAFPAAGSTFGARACRPGGDRHAFPHRSRAGVRPGVVARTRSARPVRPRIAPSWIGRLHGEHRRQATPRRPTAPMTAWRSNAWWRSSAGRCRQTGIVTLDAGTFAAPAYRIVPFRPPQRLLAPIAGAMGFGVPAAVAAGLRHPGADGHLSRRRRRVPDDRQRTGRGARTRPVAEGDRVGQPLLRLDPHQPGAAVIPAGSSAPASPTRISS